MSIHRYFLQNGTIRETGEASLFAGQLGLLSGWGIFSTLRVADGALFAWDRHWARMSGDARLLNVEMPPSADDVEKDLIGLVQRNRAPDCTLRLVVVRNGGGMWEGPASGRASDTIALTTRSKKWGANVRLGIQPHARYAAGEFTRAKVLSWAQNLRWAEKAQEQGLDEVILLNEFGRVTECTSANVFAVFGRDVVTPALSEGCLPGVTRDVVLRELQLPGIRVAEGNLTVDELHGADEVFITSTTRGLLPVLEFDGRRKTGGNEICARLTQAFNSYVAADVSRRRHAPVHA